MSAIHFVVRDPSGILQNGSVIDSDINGNVILSSGAAVSMDARRLDVTGYVRQGSDLVLLMANGNRIVLEDYFGPDGNPQSTLYLNEGGHLIETEVSATGTVTHTEVATWGKWGDLSELTFPSDPVVAADGTMVSDNAHEVAAVQSGSDDDEVSMAAGFGLFPLAGLGGAGAGAAAGAGVLGTAALLGGAAAVAGGGDGDGSGGGGGGGGGSSSTMAARIDAASESYSYNGASQKTVTITGQAEPGSQVLVSIGSKTVTVTSNAEGRWSAGFSGGNFPGDGQYTVTAKVTEQSGKVTNLDGQTIVVDTTPPDVDVTGYGANVNGTVINAVEHRAGFTLNGTGEAGAQINVLVNGHSQDTTVAQNGTWFVDIARGDLPTGDYDIDVQVTATDAFDNVSTTVHTMTVDTIAPALEIGPGQQAGDDVVNSAEARAGVDITGRAEPGASVQVTMLGETYSTIASQAGTWTVTFQPEDFPAMENNTTITAIATDAAGNVSRETQNILIDTVAPDVPYVTAYTRAGDTLRGFSVDVGDSTADITTLTPAGVEGQVNTGTQVFPGFPNEVYFDFPSGLQDGRHLVITKSDDAGNESGTLFALDKNLPNNIDLTNPGLTGNEIEAIDLRFAEDSTLTIDSDILANLSNNSNSLTIHGTGNDGVTVDTANGATFTDTTQNVTIGGESYSIYTLGDDGGTLIIDDDINIT